MEKKENEKSGRLTVPKTCFFNIDKTSGLRKNSYISKRRSLLLLKKKKMHKNN